MLTGKYRPGEQPPEGSRATDEKGGANMIKRWMRDDVLERVQQLKPLAEEAGLSMAALAVAWVLQNDNVATAIIGASRPEQVHDNVAAAGVTLDADLLAKIDEMLDPVVERDPAKTTRSSPKTREADRCPFPTLLQTSYLVPTVPACVLRLGPAEDATPWSALNGSCSESRSRFSRQPRSSWPSPRSSSDDVHATQDRSRFTPGG